MKIVLREWIKTPKNLVMMIIGAIFAGLSHAMAVSNERLLATIFDTFGDPVIIAQFALGLLLSAILMLVNKYTSRAIHYQYTTMTNCMSDKILHSEYNLFLQYPSDRINSITEQLFQIVGSVDCIGKIVRYLINIVILIFAIHRIIPEITWPIVAVYVIGACILWKIYMTWESVDKTADKWRRVRNHELDMITNGFKEVRGFCTEATHQDRVVEYNTNTLSMFCKRQNVSMMITVVFRIINVVTYALVLAYCLPKLISDEISPAFAVLLTSYAVQLSDPMESALDVLDELSQRLARVDEYEKFMSYKDHYVVQRNNINLSAFRNEIRLDNVSFAYSEEGNSSDDVLRNVSMMIKMGEHVGICGESGGGKTTLFNLLMDYYTPNKGSVTIDGIDYRDIDPSSIRNHVGIVNQDIYIFDDTLWYNVAYGKPSATESEVVEACKKAGIYDFICKLKDGFQTKVGPRGLKLSGGQKQRIGLARVFLVDPEIILLDEATSALDNESETIVQDALASLQGKTVITIAHRLSTIRSSDRIYVIDNGHVAESGTHDELMSMGGVYARLNK